MSFRRSSIGGGIGPVITLPDYSFHRLNVTVKSGSQSWKILMPDPGGAEGILRVESLAPQAGNISGCEETKAKKGLGAFRGVAHSYNCILCTCLSRKEASFIPNVKSLTEI